MPQHVQFIARRDAVSAVHRDLTVTQLDRYPPQHREVRHEERSAPGEETKPERIVLIDVAEPDRKALEGVFWTHFAVDRDGRWTEGMIRDLEFHDPYRLSFTISYGAG